MKTHLFVLPLTVLSLATCVALGGTAVEPTPTSIRAVIVSGVDWKGHFWKETGPAVRQILEKDPRFDVRIIEDPAWLAGDGLAQYDLCVLMFKNYDPLPQEERIVNHLASFVELGKGRVFHTTLGHDVKGLTMPGTSELIRRGAAWAAGRN
jgi:type 1 glutamine amidotransferase